MLRDLVDVFHLERFRLRLLFLDRVVQRAYWQVHLAAALQPHAACYRLF